MSGNLSAAEPIPANAGPESQATETSAPPVLAPPRRGFQRIYRWSDPVGWLVPLASAIFSFLAAAALFRSTGIALALLALIFVHEIGHIIALRLKRIPVSAPIFIPLVGAFVVTGQIQRARDAALVALAGPFTGGLGALACLAISRHIGATACLSPVFTGVQMNAPCFSYLDGPGYFWLELAFIGFLFNLINLLPLFPLDGGRVAAAVARWLWPLGILMSVAFLLVNPQPLTWILVFGAIALTIWERWQPEPLAPIQSSGRDKAGIIAAYAGLVLLLAAGLLLTLDYTQLAHLLQLRYPAYPHP